MMKRILTLALASALLFGAPFAGVTRAAVEIIEQEFQSISVTVVGSIMHVTGANGQILQVYNVAGVCVMTLKVDGNDKRYDLNLPKGYYIVKVGKAVKKFPIK